MQVYSGYHEVSRINPERELPLSPENLSVYNPGEDDSHCDGGEVDVGVGPLSAQKFNAQCLISNVDAHSRKHIRPPAG